MSIFGWSYPPGAANDPSAPYNQDGSDACEVCGQSVDACICPECPVCECCGDPACYDQHGLVRSLAQVEGRAALDAAYEAAAERDRAEAAYEADPQRKAEAAALEEYWKDVEAHHQRKETT
jgi:hypothetical protein